MAKMCNCKRGFIQDGRCCCAECDADRRAIDYYRNPDAGQSSTETEPIRQQQRKRYPAYQPPPQDGGNND